MKKEIILSILIPTYNRVLFLETGVENLVNQIKSAGLQLTVEIVIGNDASKDDTSKYVDEITTQYDFVRGFNHPKNLGLSQNIEFLVKEAHGKYILISGDDDLLRAGAIAYYLQKINEEKPNFILVNTSNIVTTENGNCKFDVILENRLEISDNIFVENFEKDRYLLEPTHNWLYLTNFLTAVIFRKDLYESEMNRAKKYLRPENVWLWQAPVIIGIKKYGRLLVIANCFVLCRKSDNNWVNDVRGRFYVSLFDSTEISNLIKDYMPSEYKKYKKYYAFFVMKEFVIATEKGKNIRKSAWSAFVRNLDCFPENIQFLSMVIMPNFVANNLPKLKALRKIFKFS